MPLPDFGATTKSRYSIILLALLLRIWSSSNLQAQCLERQSGIIAWWAGDGDYREFIARRDGIGHPGVSFTAGMVGNAYQFDGTLGYVDSAIPIRNLVTTQFSVESWIWIDRMQDNCIVSQYDTLSRDASWAFIVRPEGTLDFGLYAGPTDGPARYRKTAPGTLTTNRWIHVAATVDLASQPIRLFVDGIEASTEIGFGYNDTFTQFYQSSSPIRIGAIRRHIGDIVSNFAGKIDELALFNRALDPTEIAQIVAAGSAGRCRRSPSVALNRVQDNATRVSCIPLEFTLLSAASEGDERILRVEYFDADRLIASSSDSNKAWSAKSSPLAHGLHQLSAQVVDAFGLRATSQVEVLDLVRPTLLEMHTDQTSTGETACCMGTVPGDMYTFESAPTMPSAIWTSFMTIQAEATLFVFTNRAEGLRNFYRGRTGQ
ncbi:MAG: LamG domain-containing protein [Verrucomicrobiales bacterium]|nr:LamG domain-containing protein [Verrucomicrobiales bacterium]